MDIPDDIVETGISLKDRYFDLKGLVVYSALGVSTLREHIRKDGLPCFRIRGKVLIKRSEFDLLQERFRVNKHQDLGALVDEMIEKVNSDN